MSDGWTTKRFWIEATVAAGEGGYAVLLDGRPVCTPARRHLVVPTAEMAERIAAEWRVQEDNVDPLSMPWTCSANAAIDKVATQRSEVEEHLIGYAGIDLLSYRAEGPAELVERQLRHWDPILDWVAETFGVRLATTVGVMPVEQEPVLLELLRAEMDPMSDFQLTGFHDLVTLAGSYAIALAATRKVLPPDNLWSLTRLDEAWQNEQWGIDEEAAEAEEIKRRAFLHATEFYRSA